MMFYHAAHVHQVYEAEFASGEVCEGIMRVQISDSCGYFVRVPGRIFSLKHGLTCILQ